MSTYRKKITEVNSTKSPMTFRNETYFPANLHKNCPHSVTLCLLVLTGAIYGNIQWVIMGGWAGITDSCQWDILHWECAQIHHPLLCCYGVQGAAFHHNDRWCPPSLYDNPLIKIIRATNLDVLWNLFRSQAARMKIMYISCSRKSCRHREDGWGLMSIPKIALNESLTCTVPVALQSHPHDKHSLTYNTYLEKVELITQWRCDLKFY